MHIYRFICLISDSFPGVEKTQTSVMRNILLHQVLTVHVLLTCYAVGFEFPTNYSADAAIISKLDVTSNCSDGGIYACNSKCPNREDFPTLSFFIAAISSPCKKIPADTVSIPQASNVSNGQLVFNASTTGCSEISHTYSLATPYFFTLTMWIKASCTLTTW